MENTSHASEQLTLDGSGRPSLDESPALMLPEDSHPSLFNPEEQMNDHFQVAYY
jgi:hypothetical protein